ncbi:MAG: beta-propeller domain-containing protein, partial [Planctomycetales bacterium]|nr:beta-propeller domain-containing protein [Planctomycetales bacterium]
MGRGANGKRFAELQISIFDVSDPTDPIRTHLYSLDGGRNTSTELTGNRWTNGDGDHHAVTYLVDARLLALPVMNEAAGGNWAQNGQPFESGVGGLLLFHIDPAEGIQRIASIEHDTMIRRAVHVGDRLYAVSSSAITAIDIANPA